VYLGMIPLSVRLFIFPRGRFEGRGSQDYYHTTMTNGNYSARRKERFKVENRGKVSEEDRELVSM
jgi:hypothetical protein